MLSPRLEQTLHRSLALANQRRHEYATLEHLLLALTEDQDAVAVLRACGVDIERLRRDLGENVARRRVHPQKLDRAHASPRKDQPLHVHHAMPGRRPEDVKDRKVRLRAGGAGAANLPRRLIRGRDRIGEPQEQHATSLPRGAPSSRNLRFELGALQAGARSE